MESAAQRIRYRCLTDYAAALSGWIHRRDMASRRRAVTGAPRRLVKTYEPVGLRRPYRSYLMLTTQRVELQLSTRLVVTSCGVAYSAAFDHLVSGCPAARICALCYRPDLRRC